MMDNNRLSTLRAVQSETEKGGNLGRENPVLGYVQACTIGKLPLSDCGPVWQIGVIATLLVAAIMVLTLLIMRPQGQSAPR